MSKFNLKLAGQYSNNLSSLINELMFNQFYESNSMYDITEKHLKSKIKVNNEELGFEDEEVKKEQTRKFKEISIKARLELMENLVQEKSKIDSIIAQKVKESKLKSVFTGEEIDIDLAKQENILYKTKLLPSFEQISLLKDEDSQTTASQPVAFGDSISNVPYIVEVHKKVNVDRDFLENKKLEILKKLDEQSMEIDKVKTNSEFEFENKYDVRITMNKLISLVENEEKDN